MYRASAELKFKGLASLIENYCEANGLMIVDDRFNILIEDTETGDIRDVLEVYR